MAAQSVISAVMATIEERKRTMPEKSYVVKLLKGGTDAAACKLAEETGEVIKACREETQEQQIKEFGDLFFHALVLMAQKDIKLEHVEAELAKRHGISGLDEKAARKKS